MLLLHPLGALTLMFTIQGAVSFHRAQSWDRRWQERHRRSDDCYDEELKARLRSGTVALWKAVKSFAPPVVTGAYDRDAGDSRPFEAMYNLVFVRIPTIAAGLLYFQRVSDGQPAIVMDLGLGDCQLSPVVVAAAMYLVLRPADQPFP